MHCLKEKASFIKRVAVGFVFFLFPWHCMALVAFPTGCSRITIYLQGFPKTEIESGQFEIIRYQSRLFIRYLSWSAQPAVNALGKH